MPTNLYSIPRLNCKSIKLTCFFLFLPLFFFGQSLTGLWIGTVSNDSNTVRKDQSFEIALTEYKGKVYGYSRSEFIVDDVLYYIVKRVSGTIMGDVCEVTDDEIVSYNFPKLLDKKVKVTSTFRRDKNDSTWYLAGKWKTNTTKKYYSVTGRVDLEEEKDLTASKIFPHLEELKLADAIVFYKERKEGSPIVKIAKPEKTNSGVAADISPLTTNTEAIAIADKPNLPKSNNSIAGTSSNIETNKEQASASKTTAAKEEPTTNTDLTAVKRADNMPKTETKNIPSTKVTVTPSSNSVAAQTKPAAEDKNSNSSNEQVKNNTTTPDVVFAPVLERMENPTTPSVNTTVTKTEPANTTAKETLAKNNDAVKQNTTTAVTNDKKENTVPVKQDVAANTKTNLPANTNAGVKSNTTAANEKKENTTVVKQDVAANTKPVNTNTETKSNPSAIQQAQNTGGVKPNTTAAVTTDKKENTAPVKQDVAVNTKPVTKPEATTASATENKVVKTDAPPSPLIPDIKTPTADITLKAAIIAGRKSEFSQQVNFKSDSLQVALYDNGEIDGDTVSVFMNGEVIMAKQGLKSSAIRKTIYLTPGQEEFTLVLFAENLGKYPPNTGLLVVRDGDEVYNLRFSSDFQKNTGIVFRKKK